MSENEIKALINLLDDPNQDVFQVVTENLIRKGKDIIPELEKAWESAADQVHQERLEEIIQKIQFNHNCGALHSWKNAGSSDLLEGTFLIARFQYPDLQFSQVNEHIEKIKRDVWIELNNNLTALEKIRILNHILFDIHTFSKSTGDFYNPHNSFINKVLETKQGNPISLAIIYAVIAQRLGLPVFGVNLPKNFILAYRDESGLSQLYRELQDDILFYINPYNKGSVHSRREIEHFLKQQGIAIKDTYFQTCGNMEIVERIINNLIKSYERQNNPEKSAMFKEVLEKLKGG
jgi:regulator of sirC expression with transglutaminase-like and TPR domain